MLDGLELYNYFRSSCSYRVRVALELKNLPYTYHPVHLLKDGGEQFDSAYLKKNPTALVPTLVTPDITLGQSLVIMEFLDEERPEPQPLFPKTLPERFFVKELCEIINSSTQPLCNLGVLQALEKKFSASPEQKKQWIEEWTHKGLGAYEKRVNLYGGLFSVGDEITAADLCLVPQIFSADRFGVSLDSYPKIRAINDRCLKIDAFQRAHPSNQVDAPKESSRT